MEIGKNRRRVDAWAKVTGTAKYTADLYPANCLTAKVIRSTIANGRVVSMDVREALKVPGVVKIVTCFDVPDIQFPTPGHPWSVEKSHQDIADRKLLNERVRVYGDDIGAVIAEDELAAEKAARLVRVTYETYEPLLSVEAAMAPEASRIHEEKPGNIVASSGFKIGEGDFDRLKEDGGLIYVSGTYTTQSVQHCHLEVPVSFAYMEDGRIVVVTSTQIPHIVRRVISQALGMDMGKIRVIKPYVGGGFGNKQDVLYEPLNAFLATLVGGRPVKIELSREETLGCTRVRHAITFKLEGLADTEGNLIARRFAGYSNQGGYASHAHAIMANAANIFKQLYQDKGVLESKSYTVYTNIPTGGAMRGYGIPQGDFGTEAFIEDMAWAVGMDPLEFRLKNCMKAGYKDPHLGIACYSYGLKDCMEKGRAYIHWDEKREAYAHQTGPVRRGVGMAIFCYKTGVHPISLETASCRMILNQDGSMQLQMGAAEIGQGADTVFTQMAAESTGISAEKIHIQTFQDTDVSPFDTGAYASRQTYVSGKAIRKTGLLFKSKILAYASEKLHIPGDDMDIRDDAVVDKESGDILLTLGALAEEAFYSLDHSVHITAEATSHCKDNTFATGACFVELEVDIPVGKIKIRDIINVHDSGRLINPKLAEAQVHGGMSMGLGYALGEKLIIDDQGRPRNADLLDYKMPTAMDTPDLHAAFVEIEDETGPYGNKALGEPPAIPVAPAVRNALLHATGIHFNALPLDPQTLVERFMKEGLIETEGTAYV